MSLTLNMVGGGGGSGEAFAFIRVTYPAGSVCTATNGTKTLTASDTSGYFVFQIPTPTSLPETWTVSCTDGTNTTTQTVSISFKGQSEEVALIYKYFIIQNGVFANGLSFSKKLRNTSVGTITENYNDAGYLRIYQQSSAASTGGSVTDLINLTDYNTIGYEASFVSAESTAYGTVGAFNKINQTTANAVTGSQVATARLTQTQQIGEIDISSINESLYIGAMLYVASNQADKTLRIWNLWLE